MSVIVNVSALKKRLDTNMAWRNIQFRRKIWLKRKKRSPILILPRTFLRFGVFCRFEERFVFFYVGCAFG